MIAGQIQKPVKQGARRRFTPRALLAWHSREQAAALRSTFLLCLFALLFQIGCGTHYGTAPATGTSSKYGIRLTWNAPGGSDPAVSYNVYRELTAGTMGFQQINASPVAGPTYTDRNVQLDTSYTYVVRALDADGGESDPSNTATVVVPSQ